jgi:hypothetical protein
MLRSLCSALVVTALVAAPASAQFTGAGPGNGQFDPSAFGGPGQFSNGFSASNGLTQIGNQPDVVAVVPTPEPTSVALVATGLVGMFGIARRKRNSRHG